ncbi:MAG: hypothetical protein KC589_04170 [Nanoarchaeota archaeon]|nr:hypothetical protein [Nanoarchaeota archaeon]MCA9496113.1 hypothetical protein [Nanoarchaeota archaeon]
MNEFKIIILVLSFLSFLGLAFSSSEVLIIDYSYSNTQGFGIEDVYVASGFVDENQKDGIYEMRTYDRNGVELDRLKFNIEEVHLSADEAWFDDDGNQRHFPEEEIFLYGTVKMPFYQNLDSVAIFDAFGEEVYRINMDGFLGKKVDNINFELNSDLDKGHINLSSVGGIVFIIVVIIIGFFLIRKRN